MPKTDTSPRRLTPPPTPAANVRRRAWLTTWLLVAFMMVNFADKSVLGLAADDIRRDLHLSATDFGLANSAFFLLFSIAAVVVGVLADRIRAKWLLLVMGLVWSAAQLPSALGGGLAVLVASRIVLGAAEGPAFPLAQQTSLAWFPDRRRNLPGALITLGVTFGVILASPGLTWVIQHHGWRSAFGVVSVIGLAWALVWWRFGRDDAPAQEEHEEREEHEAQEEHEAPQAPAAKAAPYRRIFGTGTWIGTTIAYFTSYWGVALMLVWMPSYLHDGLHHSSTTSSRLVVLPWALGALVLLGQAALTSRLLRRGVGSRWARGRVGALMLVIGAACCLGVGAVDGSTAKTALAIIGFGFGGALAGVASTSVVEIAPLSRRGGTLGVMNAVVTLSGLLAPTVIGRLVDADGSAGYQHAVLLSGALLLVGAVVAAVLVDPERDARKIRAWQPS